MLFYSSEDDENDIPCSVNKDFIYLDFNATTPMDPEVIGKVKEVMCEGWGNPSSNHPPGMGVVHTLNLTQFNLLDDFTVQLSLFSTNL